MTHLHTTYQRNAPKNAMDTLELLGGRLCLDFVNTVDSRLDGPHRDWLTSSADLVQWGYHVGILTEQQRQNVLQATLHDSIEAHQTFERAITLRETLYRAFFAIVRGTVPQRTERDVLRDAFAEAIVHASLLPIAGKFAWNWFEHEETLDGILGPIIASAVELLTSEQMKNVKQCPGVGDCGWLFLDTSKNGSRVWCSMQDCGSRAKMRRQYARKQASH